MFGTFSLRTGLAEIWSLVESWKVITVKDTQHNTDHTVTAQTLVPVSLSLPQLLALLTTFSTTYILNKLIGVPRYINEVLIIWRNC